MASEHGSALRLRRDSPFVLDIRAIGLGRRAGSSRPVDRRVLTQQRIGLDLIYVPEGDELDLDLLLESVVEGVLVTGTVRAATAGECSRCLEPLEGAVEIRLTELFAYPDSATEATTEEDDVHRVVDDLIDLEPVIVDAIGVELPLQPLCTDDCPGLCAECGIRLAIAEPGHGHEILDPRWAALAGMARSGADEDVAGSEAEMPPTQDRHNARSTRDDRSAHTDVEEK